MKRRTLLTGAAALGACPVLPVRADTYPSRAVRMIVPFAPGGSSDFIARVIGDQLAKELGQPVVIENKGGVGGALGTMEMVRGAADGYTLVMATPSVTAATPAANPNAGYSPVLDVTAIVNVAAAPSVLAVHPSFPARNFKDFIAELKRKPDKYSYATPGVGGIVHLQMEWFKLLTGTAITHVPFKGAGPGLLAAVGGQCQIIHDTLPSSLQFVRDGKLIPIAITAPERRKELPDVPTFAEVGLQQLNYMGHFGLLGPKGLSRDIVDKVNAATKRAVSDPTVRKRIEESGAVVIAGTPAEFATEIKQVYEPLRKAIVDKKLVIEQ